MNVTQKFQKNLYKKCNKKCGVLSLGTRKRQTPHAGLAIAARGVCNFPVRRSLSPHAEFGRKARSVCPFGAGRLYFLCPVPQNASSGTPDFKGKRVLSAFLALGVEKCHRCKNKPSESVPPERMFTNGGTKKPSLSEGRLVTWAAAQYVVAAGKEKCFRT